MADNTLLNSGTGGDTYRSKDKGGIKTPVSIIDIGGAGAEALLTAGQQAMSASVPVVIASNQSAVPTTATLQAGSAVIGKVSVDQTTPGTTNLVEARTSARRNAGVLHRSAVAAADKLAVPATPTLVAVTEAGSTLANVAYNVTVAAANRWGATTSPATASITPAANQAVRATIGQVAGADAYDIFLSTGSSPLWVGRLLEADRAAGGKIISTVGTVTSGGGAGAGAVDLGVVGTGAASNTNPFAFNNAYTPATPTPINCAGYSRAVLHVKLAVTDLRSLPALTLVPFFQDQTSTADWFADLAQAVSILTADGQPLGQQFSLDVNGATALVVLVSSIAGQGAACSVWVELA